DEFSGRKRAESYRTDHRSNDLDRIGGHPDVHLPEPALECLLEVPEEFTGVRIIGRVYENTNEVVEVDWAGVFSLSADRLGFGRNGAEALAKFQERLADDFVGNRRAVIEPKWKQDFVSPVS